MQSSFGKSKRYIILAVFLVAAVLSVLLMGRVSINYNVSDYLDEETEIKIALGIIEEEFGVTGDIQVMIEDISVETAREVRDTLKGIENVLVVNFDESDEGYYKNGNALFIVIVDGDEYSDVANAVVEDIRAALDDAFAGKLHYGGAVMEKATLRDAMEGEIPFILAISVCLTIAIMLLTSKSWLEPPVLLLASGVAILINMGTNAVFGEISYITNAVAAILQLALSIDYSIVLLHGYRKHKEAEPDKGKAMASAVRDVIKPVSASALTTIAGLLALLFMSMRIGFDIGIVLIKGIVISAIVSLTLLPVFLLFCDTLLNKTKKWELVLKGRCFCRMAFKASKAIVPIALALIIVCGTLQFGNTYSFTDDNNANPIIGDTFGRNNTIVVVYPKNADNNANEARLAERLTAYKTADGRLVLKNYTAYSNTVRALYDVDLATRKLGLARGDVELLFTMYHLYGDTALVKIAPREFIEYADDLIETDADAASFSNAEMTKTLRTLLVIDEMMNGTHTAEAFHTLATTGVMEGTTLSLFAIKQMYGLYSYDRIANKKIGIKDILTFATESAENGALGSLIDADAVAALGALSDGVVQLEAQMAEEMTKAEFCEYMLTEQGIALSEAQASLVYSAYFADKNGVTEETIHLLTLLNYLVESGQITDAAAVDGVAQLNELYALDVAAFRAQMDKPMSRDDFKQYMLAEQGIALSDIQIGAIYYQYGMSITQKTIPFLPLLTHLADNGYVTDPDAIAQIAQLNQLYDTDLEGMQAALREYMTQAQFREYLATDLGVTLDAAQVDLIYSAYFGEENGVVGDTIPFLPLMNYLVEVGQVTDSSAIATIDGCNALMEALPEVYAYDELLPLLSDVVETLTGATPALGFDDLAIQQMYIMYFYDKGTVPTESVLGKDFVDLVVSTAATNPIVRSQLSDDTMLKLEDLYTVNDFMSEDTEYDFAGMTDRIATLGDDIKSLSASTTLGEGTAAGLYIKYAIANDLVLLAPIVACDLLNFVVDNMNTHELLSAKMSAENREKVAGAQGDIDRGTALFVAENYSRVLLSVNLPSEGEEANAFVGYLLDEVKDVFGEGAHIAGGMVSSYDLKNTFDDDNRFIAVFTIVSIFLIVMAVFRSISLPVILVAVIQGSIWIAMSTSLITGPMFFMSYIVATCILMGATIDYGILMATSYIRNRETLDKKESLYKAVEAAMPTVFTSGVILTVCGFVIGLISSQSAIATVGTLLGKGTLVSVLMITLVLPSVLYLLDGFILKLSLGKKNTK